MRLRRLLTIFLTAGLLAVPAIPAIAAHDGNRHCTVPRGWRVVKQDHQAVVDRQQHQQSPAYEFCNRMAGRWRGMIAAGSEQSTGPIEQLTLAGRFVAYETSNGWPLRLWDTRSGQSSEISQELLDVSPPPVFLLSPRGVAARLVTEEVEVTGYRTPEMAVETLTIPRAMTPVLEFGQPAGSLTNLQLFDCSAGCQADTAIVAWTQAGQPRYAQIQGSS